MQGPGPETRKAEVRPEEGQERCGEEEAAEEDIPADVSKGEGPQLAEELKEEKHYYSLEGESSNGDVEGRTNFDLEQTQYQEQSQQEVEELMEHD